MKKYGVILADPPWQYRNNKMNGAAENHYSVMTDQDIANLQINIFTAENCVLLLWATWPKLQEAVFHVINQWGFEYKTGFPWIKIKGIPRKTLFGEIEINANWGTGFWVKGISEPILIATKGKIEKEQYVNFAGLLSDTIRHSRKPDSIYQYAEYFPGPYLELFARRKRPGWDCWGNEIESDVEITL